MMSNVDASRRKAELIDRSRPREILPRDPVSRERRAKGSERRNHPIGIGGRGSHEDIQISGRPKAVYRKFLLSRIVLREMAHQGLIPGMKKSSW